MSLKTDGFAGFNQDALTYLAGLANNNTRVWFAQRKAIYEAEIAKPAKACAAALAEALGDLTGKPQTSKVLRIYRDVRFSKDKTPYHARVHMAFSPEGAGASTPMWFFGLDPDKLTLGAGVFAFDGDALARFRQVAAGPDGAVLAQCLSDLTAAGFVIRAPDLKRVPAGFDKTHPQSVLLRHKGVSVWTNPLNPEVATRSDLVERCLENFSAMLPLVHKLDAL